MYEMGKPLIKFPLVKHYHPAPLYGSQVCQLHTSAHTGPKNWNDLNEWDRIVRETFLTFDVVSICEPHIGKYGSSHREKCERFTTQQKCVSDSPKFDFLTHLSNLRFVVCVMISCSLSTCNACLTLHVRESHASFSDTHFIHCTRDSKQNG